ncbi:MAG: ParB/RepB/Spo0J family partition protein, partial [Gemmatimonadota bacterium]|nr:ParB/RepB/Spo0J family partition protein [Gemmatimonadota bacterium]
DRGADATEGGRDLRVPIGQIRPAKYQARMNFTEGTTEGLADSIRQHGVLEPLLVRATNGGYEIIAGERRLHAAKRAGLEDVPVRVLRATDAEAEIWSIIENVQRENLSAWEEAQAVSEIRRRRTARGEATSGAAIASAFSWSEAKCSERCAISERITPEVRERAGTTPADLCGLSKAVLLRAAQADAVEARADILRDAVRPPGGDSGMTPENKGRPPSAPAGLYSLREAANGITTIRIDPSRTRLEETEQAIGDLTRILGLLRGRSRDSAEAAREVVA